MSTVRQGFTAEDGKTPAEVAAIVLDAIRANRFWIISHEGVRETLQRRFDEILDNAP